MVLQVDDDGQTVALREAGRRLTKAVMSTAGKDQGLVDSRDVAEALSDFLLLLRAADARADGSPRFERDDGIVLLTAQQSGDSIDVYGYIWWISQALDPIWARFEIDPQEQVLRRHLIRCGVRRVRPF